MRILPQLVLLAAVAASVMAFWIVAEKKRRKRLSRRKTIDFSEWYDMFYGPQSRLSPQSVKFVIEAIAHSIGVQATQVINLGHRPRL